MMRANPAWCMHAYDLPDMWLEACGDSDSLQVLNTAIRGRPSSAAAAAATPGGTAAAAAPAAPPPAIKAGLFLGRRSKSSALLAGIAKQARPAARPPATAVAAASGGGAATAAAAAAAQPRTGSKVIVFSQWTSMLDLVEAALAGEGLPFRRLDGTMSLAARDTQLQDFKRDPAVVVLLLSLRAASLGLNLVVANHVVLLDLWWNPAVEDQAIDRTHRIGQTRDVTVRSARRLHRPRQQPSSDVLDSCVRCASVHPGLYRKEAREFNA